MMAAATVSSQQASVKGEISPIKVPSLSTTATEVCSASERDIDFTADEAGE